MRPALSFSRTTSVAAAALLIAVPLVGHSAASDSREQAYRCRDAKGQAHYGQSIPEVCMDLDIEVLDGAGRVIRTIPGRRSLDQVAAKQAADDAAKTSAQRDRTLLATYLSVADIERLRDQRVELLEQQSRVTEQYIANLRERESRLVSDAQRFRPYSDRDGAAPLPEYLAEEMVNTVNGRQVYEQELAKNTGERNRLRTEFDADIARFKELKGVK